MTPEEQLDALRSEAAAFHAAVRDLDALVPACPSWRVRDLVYHLGSVHRMFRRVADEGWMQRPPRLEDDDRPPVEDDSVAAWARRETRALLAALERLEPTSPRWNFTDGPQVGAFVFRRMLHETTVHRHDVQVAYGHADVIAAEIAADGVREFLDVQVPWSGTWSGRHVRVSVVMAGEFLGELELSPAGPAVFHAQPRADTLADLRLCASAKHLLLALWGRGPLNQVAHGETELVAAFRAFLRT